MRTSLTIPRRRELLNNLDEWHAFCIGFFEVLCPWPPRIRIPSPSKGEGKGEGDNPSEPVSKEYHYYSFGRAMAVIAWIIIAKIEEAFATSKRTIQRALQPSSPSTGEDPRHGSSDPCKVRVK